MQQKITESLVLIKKSQTSGDTSHMDAIFDSLLTELNLQEHLKKMIEKMNMRRLKQVFNHKFELSYHLLGSRNRFIM